MAMGPVNVPAGNPAEFFEIDTHGGIMPSENPIRSDNFELDANGAIMRKEHGNKRFCSPRRWRREYRHGGKELEAGLFQRTYPAG